MIGVESNGRARFRSNAGDMPGTIAYYLSSNILVTIQNNETRFAYVMLPASMVSTCLLFGTEYVSYDQDKSGKKKEFALSFDLP